MDEKEKEALSRMRAMEWTYRVHVSSSVGSYLYCECPFCSTKKLALIHSDATCRTYKQVSEGQWNYIGYSAVHKEDCPYAPICPAPSGFASNSLTQYKIVGIDDDGNTIVEPDFNKPEKS